MAALLREWLPLIISGVEPFISSNINAGARWQSEIATELDTTDFGIVCVTAENQRTPWLNFEAGALSKKVGASLVVPLAIDLSPVDIQYPLAQFQAQKLDRDGMSEIARSISDVAPGSHHRLIQMQMDMWWPKLEQDVQEIDQELRGQSTTRQPTRTDRDLLEDILITVRSLSRIDRIGVEHISPLEKQRRSLYSALLNPFNDNTENLRSYAPLIHASDNSIFIITAEALPRSLVADIWRTARELGISGLTFVPRVSAPS